MQDIWVFSCKQSNANKPANVKKVLISHMRTAKVQMSLPICIVHQSFRCSFTCYMELEEASDKDTHV